MPSLESTCENSSANMQSKRRVTSLEKVDSRKNAQSVENLESSFDNATILNEPTNDSKSFNKNAQILHEPQIANEDSSVDSMDCHATASALARNDGKNAAIKNEDSRICDKNAPTLSLRENPQGFSWQSISAQDSKQNAQNLGKQHAAEKVDSSNDYFANANTMDCHATASALARNDRNNATILNEPTNDSKSFNKNAQILHEPQAEAKVDSRNEAQNLNDSAQDSRIFESNAKNVFCSQAARRQDLENIESSFDNAAILNEPTNDSKNCGGALRVLGQFGGRSYLSGNDCLQTAPIASNCSPKAELLTPKFHIFFNASTPYLKFLSVLLHSIITHANAAPSAPFVFHILLDSRGFDEDSPQELAKLPALESLLNSVHPCTISTHDCATLLDTINAPRNQTRVIYSRLFLAHFVPECVQKALYLDVDMLALSDVREIFTSDMQDSIIAVVRDVVSKQSPLSARKATGAPYHFSPKHIYFNSGMMLINLPKWREKRIEQRCVEFLNTYCALYFDQDALNAVVGENAHYF